MKILLCILALMLAFTFTVAMPAKAGKDPTVKMDKEVHDFNLKDITARVRSLKDLSEGKKASVVMFISTQCPVSNSYNKRIVALYNDYKDKGIQFIGINSNKAESARRIAEHNKENGLRFIVLKDPGNKVADYFAAKRTPEAYLLDDKLLLRYHGAIDNSLENPEIHYLREILNLVVTGKEIPGDMKETKVFGCTIKRVRKEHTPRRSTP